uniref:Brevican n=1 Tax=Scophthalmus maximus TaxID=52904 RepID=A0A8D2ZSS8_SCOMX
LHRHVLPLLCALLCLSHSVSSSLFSAEDVQSLQVNIPHSGPVFASLGRSISIPCMVSLSTTASTSSSSSPVVPRVKWSVVSGGVETQILVAKGERVKVNEAYRYRAALLNYTSSSDDLSLWLEDLRSSDSGHYRCEVQQGLEDASDLVQLKVKGVVFHYRDALGRYAFTFHQAQRACEATGAEIATDYQLLAAYHDGYEQCDAGWVADQSVRYPIQVPREGCYGDMDGQPGLRSYGTMDPDDLFDVYCYVEQIDGEVIHDSVRKLLSFAEAQSYCRAAGAELATTAQLYLAWSEGLDRCSPGWLSDGSVRYPIITPRVRCGGPQAGVKTLYRFSNQTGFPEPSSLHDVYCFRDNRNAPTDSPVDYMATEPEDTEPDVVMLMETDEEMHLNQHAEQVEREAQSVLESFPFVSHVSTEEYLVDTHPTVTSDTTESPINTTSTLDLLQPFDETSSPTEMSSHAQHPTAMMNSTISSKETYDVPQNTSFLPSVYNNTNFAPELELHHLPQQNNLLITGPCFSDACLGDPCLNGGTCTDRDGQIKCLCLPSYGGNFCQTDLEQCEPGWDKFHGFCYRHFSQRLSWEVAEQHCRVLGAHLVSVMTPEEQSYINDNYKEYQWTGLNDKTIEDDFRWSDGNPLLYENWYRGQPDSYFLSGEDCVVMVWHDDGRWSDVPCNYHLAYTCKKGTSSCGPPPRVRNASVFGKPRQRYETNAVVRYHCAKGFQQRLNPLVRCRSGGMWERPQIITECFLPMNALIGQNETQATLNETSSFPKTLSAQKLTNFF